MSLMMRKTTLAALAMLASASATSAEEHVILYLGQAFFPSVTHINPGDTIRFVNSSASATQIVGKNSDWSVGPLGVDQELVLSVAEGMSETYYATQPEGADEDEADADDTTDDLNAITVEGTLSFDPAS